MSRERNDAGQYADGIDPDTVADVFDARDDLARPVTAGDVVDELGIARRTAHNKLNALVERGELETRKIGARGRVWWRPIPADESDEFDAADLRGDPSTTLDDTDAEDAATTAAGPNATETPPGETNAESGRTRAESDAVNLPAEGSIDDATRAVVDDAAETWEDDARLPNRKRAAMAVVQYAIDTGDAVGKSHPIVDAARDAYPVEGQNAETYWRKNIRPVLKAVGDYSRATKGYTVDAGEL